MKKNVLLLGMLISLLVGTYFFQEVRVHRDHEEALKRDQLVSEEVTHLKLPYIEGTKKDNSWWDGQKLLSHNIFKQVEKKLSEINKIKPIEGKWETFFPNPFVFEINHVKWTIGDLSLDKQAFYIAKGDEIFLAEIEGESVQLTRDEKEIAGIKLNELVSFLSRPKSDYVENQLFRFYPNLPLEKISFDIDGSLPYELNFETNSTNPPPINGIEVHKDLKGKFYSLLTQMNIKEEVPYSEKLKFKKLATLKFINSSSELVWELWLKDKKSADAYIIDGHSKKAFLMVGGTLRAFFIQVQDYWDKKVIPPKDFNSFTQTVAILTSGTKSAKVTILNREPMSFEAKGFKVDQIKMDQLVQLLFNLGPQDQVDRVSILNNSERKQLLSGDHLRVEVMGQDLLVWRKAHELIVANLTQGFKAHFTFREENFLGTFEDVLK